MIVPTKISPSLLSLYKCTHMCPCTKAKTKFLSFRSACGRPCPKEKWGVMNNRQTWAQMAVLFFVSSESSCTCPLRSLHPDIIKKASFVLQGALIRQDMRELRELPERAQSLR